MTEPVRLLETPRSGLERDLLRSALTEVAPEAVRARVLSAVDGVLGGSCSEGSAELPSAGTRRVLGFRSVHAVYLSGALAVAAAASVLLQPGAVRDSVRPAARPPAASLESVSLESVSLESVASAPALALLAPAAGAELASLPAEQGPLANTSSEVRHSSAHPSASLASRGTPRSGAGAAATGSEAPATEAEETDWLGAQLRLLGQVRELLESGQLERAGSLLDRYEQQFPGGLIGPQILRLRAELRERRSASRRLH